MEINVRTGYILHEQSDLAVMGCFEDVPLPEDVVTLLEPADFKGRTNQSLLLYPRGAVAPRRLLLVGLGSREKATAETIRRMSALAAKEAQKLHVAGMSVGINGDSFLDPEAAAQPVGDRVRRARHRRPDRGRLPVRTPVRAQPGAGRCHDRPAGTVRRRDRVANRILGRPIRADAQSSVSAISVSAVSVS